MQGHTEPHVLQCETSFLAVLYLAQCKWGGLWPESVLPRLGRRSWLVAPPEREVLGGLSDHVSVVESAGLKGTSTRYSS